MDEKPILGHAYRNQYWTRSEIEEASDDIAENPNWLYAYAGPLVVRFKKTDSYPRNGKLEVSAVFSTD